MSEFHAEASRATASEGLDQDRYVAAIAGFEPAIIRTKGVESTNEQPRPTILILIKFCNRRNLL